jgi:hypothetical protein
MKQKQKDSETPSNRARTILQNIHKQGLALRHDLFEIQIVWFLLQI